MDKVIELADKADDYADSKLQCEGEWHPDWHKVRDEYFYTIARADLEAENAKLRFALDAVYRTCDWYGDDGREAMQAARAALGETKC